MQVLEGRGEDVERTYGGICRDERHCSILKLVQNPVEQRLFPAWTMAFRRQSDLTEAKRAEFGASVTKWRSAQSDGTAATEAMILVRSFLRTM